MDQLLTRFCDIDDFCKRFPPASQQRVLQTGPRPRMRSPALALSAVLTILVYCHWSHSRTFKHYATEYVAPPLHPSFPPLLSYQRCVALLPRALVPLGSSLSTRQGRSTGRACIDSTPLAVCDKHRRATHRVFEGMATRGQTSMGWFYGCKLPIVVNDEGALLAGRLPPGHGDDRQPVARLVAGLHGQLFGDRGYILAGLA